MAVSLLLLAGLLLPMVAAGVGGLEMLAMATGAEPGRTPDPDSWSRIAERPVASLALAAGGALTIWLLAVLIHCFVQGGILGILVAGDRQAPAGVPGREWYRTYELWEVVGWGRRLVWRLFGLWVLAVAACAGWAAASALWVGLTVLAAQRWGAGAGAGVGCGGSLPVLFGWIVLLLWWQLGQVLLAEEGAPFWPSVGQALRLVGRRFGGLLLIVLLIVVAALAVNVIFMPLSMGIELALAQQASARLLSGSLLALAQWLAASVLSVLYAGALVALTRSERRAVAGATP